MNRRTFFSAIGLTNIAAILAPKTFGSPNEVVSQEWSKPVLDRCSFKEFHVSKKLFLESNRKGVHFISPSGKKFVMPVFSTKDVNERPAMLLAECVQAHNEMYPNSMTYGYLVALVNEDGTRSDLFAVGAHSEKCELFTMDYRD